MTKMPSNQNWVDLHWMKKEKIPPLQELPNTKLESQHGNGNMVPIVIGNHLKQTTRAKKLYRKNKKEWVYVTCGYGGEFRKSVICHFWKCR